MKEKVTLNRKEQKRLILLNEVIARHMTGQQAAEMLDLSLRHIRRMLARYRQDGIAALAHGNRDRIPNIMSNSSNGVNRVLNLQ
jgi:transposase